MDHSTHVNIYKNQREKKYCYKYYAAFYLTVLCIVVDHYNRVIKILVSEMKSRRMEFSKLIEI